MSLLNTRSTRRAAALALLLAMARTDGVHGQLPEHEQRFCEYLIYDLEYHDTAIRYLDTLDDRGARADIAYLKLDARRSSLPKDEWLDELEKIQKLYPEHRRSSLGSLPRISAEMGRVMDLFTRAKDTSDATRAEQFREQARRDFASKVKRPLDSLIDSLNQAVAREEDAFREVRRTNPRAPEPESLVSIQRNRNHAEFARVKIYLIYARMLKGLDELEDERRKVLEQGLEYATGFVEDRPQFYLMQYEAQLQKGLFELELGRLSDAVDDLTILIGLQPPFRPAGGYPPELVTRFKDLHLQSLLFAARAYNRDGRHGEAVDLVESKMLRPTGDAFDLSTTEWDRNLQKYFVLAQLERAVGLAGSGSPERGLAVIENLIKKYTEQASRNPVARAYVTDARKALGTIVELGGVTLTARAYYEGGLGLYSELQEEEALTLFQLGLTSTWGEEERNEVAPLCLDKIGEINYRLERFAQSAMAYLEICDCFKDSELIAKAATNAVSAASKLDRNHAGYAELQEAAERCYTEQGTDCLVFEQSKMVAARDLEEQGKYSEAREKYLEVQSECDGKKVPFWNRAQVSALNAVFQEWLQKEGDQRTAAIPLMQEVAGKLDAAVASAVAAGETDAAKMGSFVRGQIHYELREWPQVHDALKPFVSAFESDTTYRAPALYFVVESALETGKPEDATAAFAELKNDFPEAPSTQYASLLLVDYYSGLGGPENLARAALFIKEYASHPASREELQDPARLMDVIDILIEGGILDEAQKLLADAEKLAGSATKEVRNRILVRRAKFSYRQQDYRRVIESLSKFIEDYDFTGPQGPDDPEIFHMYGDAHFRLKNPPEVKDAQTAHNAIGFAVKLIRTRVDAGGEAANRRKLERQFWEWAYEWLEIKKWLSQAGDFNRLREIRAFMETWGRGPMGGEDLKKKFETLEAWAQAEFEKRQGSTRRRK